jgi:hypothetical protein
MQKIKIFLLRNFLAFYQKLKTINQKLLCHCEEPLLFVIANTARAVCGNHILYSPHKHSNE